MKFSEAWLREWVDPGLDREPLLQQLTMAGLEVDGTEPVADQFDGVVVARVVACEQHPNADKLSLCRVDNGSEEWQVVCGAPNVRVGLVTAYAQIGAVLPGNFKIKKAKLRGVESFGMLCSAAELGLGDDHDGIVELPEDWPSGSSLMDTMELQDVTIDVDLTPNRGDCLSLKGIAREVGVLNNASVAYPKITEVPATIDDTFAVKLSATEGCPRYLGRVIKGIDLSQPTPFWMRERLRRCGLRSIDPVVDVTNYVLIELGQPMHAFDLRQLNEQIDVRYATQGEQLTLLDGQNVTLDEQTLLITDAQGPVAIAGVMGGERSGVQEDTVDVFLECAFFAPLAVAGTARRYGLHTDASHRYERGVDFELQFDAIERATELLLDIVGGQAGPVVESVETAELPQRREVSLRQQRLIELLGVDIEADQVDEAFARLGFEVAQRTESAEGVFWQIVSPSHRFDIAIEADLIEEVARIYGYNNVPSRRPQTHLQLRPVALSQRGESELKRYLAGLGMQEVITYSFVDPKLQDLLDPTRAPVELANPMSMEQSVMRTNLLPGLVNSVITNVARQQSRVALFELGLVFQPQTDELLQEQHLGGVLWGLRQSESWHGSSQDVDFFDAKGVVDALLAWNGSTNVRYLPATDDEVLHPGQSAWVQLDDQRIGRVGRLHPEIEHKLDLQGVYIFELAADAIMHQGRRVYQGISKYPSVRRDLAIVVDHAVEAAAVQTVVERTLGEQLVGFRIFDVYQGQGIEPHEKSLAMGLTLQSHESTLTEDDISSLVQRALDALEAQFNSRLR